jgi:hypothetical protein
MKMKRIVLISMFLICVSIEVFAWQSIYVSAIGDNKNDGLSEAKPLKSLESAISKAKEQSIERITIIGKLDAYEHFSDLNSSQLSRMEQNFAFVIGLDNIPLNITITGKPGAKETERAVLSSASRSGKSVILVSSGAKVFFEEIEISDGLVGIYIDNGAGVTIGSGAVIQGNEKQGIYVNNGYCNIYGGVVRDNQGGGVFIGEKGEVKMGTDWRGNGAIRDNQTSGYGGGVYISEGGRFSMYGGVIQGNKADLGGGGIANCGYYEYNNGIVSSNIAASQSSMPNVAGGPYSRFRYTVETEFNPDQVVDIKITHNVRGKIQRGVIFGGNINIQSVHLPDSFLLGVDYFAHFPGLYNYLEKNVEIPIGSVATVTYAYNNGLKGTFDIIKKEANEWESWGYIFMYRNVNHPGPHGFMMFFNSSDDDEH